MDLVCLGAEIYSPRFHAPRQQCSPHCFLRAVRRVVSPCCPSLPRTAPRHPAPPRAAAPSYCHRISPVNEGTDAPPPFRARPADSPRRPPPPISALWIRHRIQLCSFQVCDNGPIARGRGIAGETGQPHAAGTGVGRQGDQVAAELEKFDGRRGADGHVVHVVRRAVAGGGGRCRSSGADAPRADATLAASARVDYGGSALGGSEQAVAAVAKQGGRASRAATSP